jgi:hypothetical protein
MRIKLTRGWWVMVALAWGLFTVAVITGQVIFVYVAFLPAFLAGAFIEDRDKLR